MVGVKSLWRSCTRTIYFLPLWLSESRNAICTRPVSEETQGFYFMFTKLIDHEHQQLSVGPWTCQAKRKGDAFDYSGTLSWAREVIKPNTAPVGIWHNVTVDGVSINKQSWPQLFKDLWYHVFLCLLKCVKPEVIQFSDFKWGKKLSG